MNNQTQFIKELKEILIFLLILFGFYLTSFYSYLLFHSITELFSIGIGLGIFLIAWNSRKNTDNSFFLALGISYLFVSIFDLLHALAYQGMGVFPDYDTNLATQLWIAARYLHAFSLLISLMLTNKKFKPEFLIYGYTIISSILLVAIFMKIFPDCYIEGEGLTFFKIFSEFFIVAMFFLSFLLMYKFRDNFEHKVFFLTSGSIITIMIAEILFTLYFNVFDIFNLIGHIFKIISSYLIYRALIKTSLKDPISILFGKLKQSELMYQEAYSRANFYKDLFVHDISNIFQNLEIYKMFQNKTLNSEEVKKRDAIINMQILRGRRLILNVRKLSDIEDTNIVLKSTNVKEKLLKSIRFVKGGYSDERINVHIDSFDNEIYVKANELLLDVFENIVLNAIKYNDNHIVKIYITASRTEENGTNYIKLEFKDNGIGVPDSKKEIIFKRGFEMDKGGKGMGLGLSLVSKLVKLYNGKFWVQDIIKGDHTKGSNFIILIPEAN